MKLATIVTLVNLILDKFKRKKQYNTHNLIFFAKKSGCNIRRIPL